MTSLNPRLLAVLAVIAAVGVGLFAYTRLTAKDDTTAEPAAPQTSSTAKSTSHTAKPTATKVVLLPGLPAPVAEKLRHSKVVVVSLYQGATPDDLRAIAGARKGARDAGAGFLTVNLANEKTARSVASMIGDVTAPALLVVKRPGKVVTRLGGPVDGELVAQAAYNAGARHR